MRILIWSDTFYPRIGGVEVMGAELVRSLRERGHELVIIGGPYEQLESEPSLFQGVPLYRFPFEYLIKPFDMEMVVRIKQKLGALLRSFRPEVFHFYHTSQGFFLHTQRAKREPAPTLLSLHGRYFEEVPAINRARRQLCLQMDWITACSQALLDNACAAVPEIKPKSSVLHNALHMPDLLPSPLDFEKPRILYVGRLHPQKRVDIAVDAFARVRDRFPKARLCIAGHGSEEPDLRAQVERLGLNQVVDFLGWVSPKEVPALINQATVMLMPSKLEPFGLVAVQGGQMARPVIATRVDGLPEVIEDGKTGILVEPENSDAMADALVKLLTQPEVARSLGEAARRHVQARFPWSKFVDEVESLYARLIDEARVRA